jgi:hypothetical protein
LIMPKVTFKCPGHYPYYPTAYQVPANPGPTARPMETPTTQRPELRRLLAIV